MSKYDALSRIPEGQDASRAAEIISKMPGLSEPTIPWDREKWNEKTQLWSILLAELKGLVPVVSVGVRDGKAFYLVTERRDGWVIFQWLDGGGDNYVSPFGYTIAVPEDVGLNMLKWERRLVGLFASKAVEQSTTP
jgi:hypothetical protein